jgi:hypothetical protein
MSIRAFKYYDFTTLRITAFSIGLLGVIMVPLVVSRLFSDRFKMGMGEYGYRTIV